MQNLEHAVKEHLGGRWVAAQELDHAVKQHLGSRRGRPQARSERRCAAGAWTPARTNHPYDSIRWRMGNAVQRKKTNGLITGNNSTRWRTRNANRICSRTDSRGRSGAPQEPRRSRIAMAGPCARAAQHTGGARPGPTRAALCAARCAEAAKCSSGDSVAAEQLPARCVWPCRPGLRMQRGRRRSVPGGSSRR